MSEFEYRPLYPAVTEDKTQYRLLTNDYVSVCECGGRRIINVDPRGLALLAREAMGDVSFLLRPAHLQQLRNIIDDPEASDNDRFVAWTLLRNQVVAAEGQLPTCQDTGTATVIATKGENIYTGADDAEWLSRGIWETYRDRNLRHSMMIPTSMLNEHNSENNLPAQIEIAAGPGGEYRFLFLAKGGGSGNKTFLFLQSKALLEERSLTEFIRERIRTLGTSACPPYHLAIVIGGTSPEANLAAVKKASAGGFDHLPMSGDDTGRAFRDAEWEERVLKMCRQSGIGAQFGGKYLVHDVRVIRLPRHAASLPVGMGVSCSADRNIKARIDEHGIWLEQLERNPARFLPAEPPAMTPPVDIDLDEGMDKMRETLSRYPVRTRLRLRGTLVVARDIAHARIHDMIGRGEPIPRYMKDYPVYYAGPANTPPGMVSGSFGPTTAGRMDLYVGEFQSLGCSLVMVGKGDRSLRVAASCARYGGFYLGSIGGPGALVAKECIRSVEVIDFPELGMEAVRKIRVENLPAFILFDDKGHDFHDGIAE
ncbi:MAG: FumA C-terminus/TtdB family hydratase beta subunit [Rikenellaceae bacterium]|nr:FumA C-terminus/TtdB family hydratase beta subunit [Rikenellaceae bacterium]MCL2693102.1 FumA C-terminus/TtdB family hydratase beta subunit [Rikenellaceae bacterium]